MAAAGTGGTPHSPSSGALGSEESSSATSSLAATLTGGTLSEQPAVQAVAPQAFALTGTSVSAQPPEPPAASTMPAPRAASVPPPQQLSLAAFRPRPSANPCASAPEGAEPPALGATLPDALNPAAPVARSGTAESGDTAGTQLLTAEEQALQEQRAAAAERARQLHQRAIQSVISREMADTARVAATGMGRGAATPARRAIPVAPIAAEDQPTTMALIATTAATYSGSEASAAAPAPSNG